MIRNFKGLIYKNKVKLSLNALFEYKLHFIFKLLIKLCNLVIRLSFYSNEIIGIDKLNIKFNLLYKFIKFSRSIRYGSVILNFLMLSYFQTTKFSLAE